MDANTVSAEKIAEMLAAAEKATPGPWERDEVENRDDRGRFTSYAVAARPSWSPDNPKHLVDTLNSGVMEIQTEHDEDGSSSWDEQGSADINHIANCDPQTITTILTELVAARSQLDALTAAERDDARAERDALKGETFKASADAAEYHRDRAIEMWDAEHTARLAAEAQLARQGEALNKAAALLEVFAEDFLKSEDTVSWAMADTMATDARSALGDHHDNR